MTSSVGADELRLSTPRGRWVLAATVLGSGLAFLDATVVNIALPELGRDLGADLAGLQWTVNGYALTLAAFILLGGTLGDRFGRKRVYMIGVAGFAVTSLLCGLAPNIETLVAARALQGVAGALLTPGSLAILQASFVQGDRARAIGAWSGLAGITGAIGPFIGGWLLEVASWRWIFLINLPFALVVLWICARHVPESIDPDAPRKLDLAGAVVGAVGLGGLTYGLTAWTESGFTDPVVLGTLALGVAGMIGFVIIENRSSHPMVPLVVFRNRQFTAANLVTFCVYAALGGVFFFLVIVLQVVAGFSPLASGVALLPITLLMLVLSARAGELATRIGPRIPMTVGPIVCALGLLLMLRIGPGASYLLDVLPGVIVFGLGLSLTVAPLTATVLAAVDDRHAGMASGVNNAVARVAGLLAVAVLPLLAGLRGDEYADPSALDAAFRMVILVCAGLLVAGGIIAFFSIRSTVLSENSPREPGEGPCADPGSRPREKSPCTSFSPVGGPPLHPKLANGNT